MADLHKQVYQNELKLKDEYLNIDYNYLPPEKYSFYYENQILNLVISGDITALKQGIADIGCSVIPSSMGDSTRAEKNYTIVILEKLSSLAIHAGKDILDTIRLRDFYIKKLETQTTLIEVLAVRDCAIIHFTKELHGLSDKKYSPLIISVIQYINLKIYDSFKIPELAKHFFMSESALRRRFKSEVGINITEYVSKRRVASAKVFLGGETLNLTTAEYRLLCLLVSHTGQILTRNAILDALWDGSGNFVDDNTLSVYIRRLREKVEENPSEPKQLLTVRGLGYRWEEAL